MSNQASNAEGAQTNGVNGDTSDRNYDIEAIVIGAGFSGMRMLYELRKQGIQGKVFESGSGVGGTWYWNRYPGARTDSESWIYIFTFMNKIGMDWTWKERFPRQPEVEQYLNAVADHLDLKKDIALNTRIAAAHRDEKNNLWQVTTANGDKYTCRYLISGTGPLATPIDPPFPGFKSFKGEWYQTGLWPKHKVDFAGKRVALIGVGATGVQVVPVVAHSCKHLTVFQRTPNFVMPSRNHPLMEEQMDEIKRDYDTIIKRAQNQLYGFDMIDSPLKIDDMANDVEVQRVLENGWEKGGFRYVFETFGDVLLSPESNKATSEFVCNKIRAIVKDKKTAELLCPNYPIVSKRPPVGHHYYEAYNRPNVELVSVINDPITEITPTGLKQGSKEYEFDLIIYALGFDSITGTLGRIDIRGSEGQALKDVFKKSLKSAYGISYQGFPNFFTIFGPQTPFANGPLITDYVTDWIGRTIATMKAKGHDRVESSDEVAKTWSNHVNEVYESLVICQSSKEVGAWIVGANVEGKEQTGTLFYFGGVPAYAGALEKEIADGYPGHTFSTAIEVM